VATSLAEQLSVCQSAELIRQVQVEPDLEYWFKHVLVQEAAYESLLKTTRAELHGRVAAAIEGSPGGRSEANAAVLAMHYENAGLDAKAFPYAVTAGDRARRTYANQEALAHYDRALVMAERLKDRALSTAVVQVYINRGLVLEVVNDYLKAKENYRAMFASAQRAGDLAMQAEAMNRLATVQTLTEHSDPEVLTSLDAALELAQASGAPALIARALWNIGLYYRFEQPQRTIETLQKALDLLQSAGASDAASAELAATIQLDLANAMWITGQFRQVRMYGERAVAAFRALGVQQLLADALGGMSAALYYFGDVTGALAAADEGQRISRAIGNPWGIVYSQWAALAIDIDRGNFEAVLDGHEELARHARNASFPVLSGLAFMHLAQARLELGQLDLAQAAADEAVPAFEEMNAPMWNVWAQGVAGRTLIRRGEYEAARGLLEPLWQPGDDPVDSFEGFIIAGPVIAQLALLERRLDFGMAFCDWFLGHLEAEGAWRLAGEMRYLRGSIWLARAGTGRAGRALGELQAAQEDLTEARARLAESEAPALLWRVDTALAELHRALGEVEAAASAQAEAVDGIRCLAYGIRDHELRRSFLRRADVRTVLDSRDRQPSP
jgi:tetratricopeptide (TPR) repeat protein